MSETLKTFALMLGAIWGWEFVKWLERRAKARSAARPKLPIPSGGKPINDRLWQFKCGCIEGFHPYVWHPCLEHRRARAAWGWWRRSEMPVVTHGGIQLWQEKAGKKSGL